MMMVNDKCSNKCSTFNLLFIINWLFLMITWLISVLMSHNDSQINNCQPLMFHKWLFNYIFFSFSFLHSFYSFAVCCFSVQLVYATRKSHNGRHLEFFNYYPFDTSMYDQTIRPGPVLYYKCRCCSSGSNTGRGDFIKSRNNGDCCNKYDEASNAQSNVSNNRLLVMRELTKIFFYY